MSVETISYYPEDLFVRDPATLREKMGAIALAGVDSLEGVIDFDNNMTKNGEVSTGSWDVLTEILPAAKQAQDAQMYAYYRPRERDHTLTTHEAETWWNRNFRLYADSKIHIEKVERASSKVVLRPGVKDFFDLCSENGVHTTIFSAGVEDVIENVIRRERVKADLIVSNRFIVDEKTGLITGWDKDNLIHTLNKKESSSQRFQEIREHRPNTFLVGDSIEDTSMVDDSDRGHVIRVRVGDPHKIPHGKVGEYLDESFMAGFDAVRLGDFRPVSSMMSAIIVAASVVHEEERIAV